MTEDEMVGWHHRFNGQTLGKLQEMVKDREAWRYLETTLSTEDTLLV